MQIAMYTFITILIASFLVGYKFSRSKANRSECQANEYHFGNRSLGWFLLMMTFVATQVGGGFILGTAEAAFTHVIWGIFYSLGQALGFLALGLGFGARLQSLKLHTAADLFEVYYGSRPLKSFASLLSIVSLSGILIAQAVAIKKFMYSLGYDGELFFLFSWFAVILYTAQGGFLAVVWTDFVQAIFMVLMLLVAFFFVMSSSSTPLAMPLDTHSFSEAPLALLVMPFLFMFIEQDMVQRCFAGRSKRDVTIGALMAACVLFGLAFIPVYFGMLGSSLGIAAGPTSKFMEVVKSATNGPIISAASCAVLLAIVSTASSLLSAISSNISSDFLSKKRFLRTTTFATGCVALGASYLSSDIFTWMIASYELAVDCLFVPLVAAVFLKERCRSLLPAALLSVACGFAGFLVEQFMGLWVLMPLSLSASGYAIGYFLRARQFTSSSTSPTIPYERI